VPATRRQSVPTLLAISDERLRDGLRVMLAAAPSVLDVEALATSEGLADWLDGHAEGLVIFDFEALEAADRALAQLKARRPRVRYMVIAGNLTQLGLARQAGADVALLSGFSSQELLEAIQTVLNRRLQRS